MDETNTRITADAATSFPSFLAMRAKHSELLQLEPDTGEGKEQWLKEIEEFIRQVQATGAILSEDEERRSGQNILNYWVSTLYRQDQVARLVTLADFDRTFNATVSDAFCPYPGVRAFTEEDSPFFFGRQRQIAYMVGRLKEDRLLVIVGPSGSGKTSLVQAGLLPALRREQSEHFFFSPILPGSLPLRSLALMIQKAKDPTDLGSDWVDQQAELFRKDQGHLLKLIEEFTDKPVVIFIDQGEELYERSMPRLLRPFENIFDFDNSSQTVEPFLDNLIRVLQSPARKHIIVVARRSGDFEPYIKRLPTRVKEVFEPSRVVLPALYASELGDAIQKPAELLGVRFEEPVAHDEASASDSNGKQGESILSALVKEISSEPVGLPLLQFVLPLLWEKREGKIIPDRAFRELRSCRAALSDTAEKFYTSLDSSDQRACRFVLTQMVTLDSDLKAHIIPVRRSTLHEGTERAARVDNLIDRLSKMELVRVTNGEIPADDWVELSHDSLITTWPTMSKSIESKKWARRRSQALKVMGLAAVIALVMLSALIVIGWQQQRSKSRDLARLSTKHFNYNRLDLALMFGREGYAVEPNVTTESNILKLLYALQSTSRPKMFLYQEDFEADDVVFAAADNGHFRRVAAVDSQGNVLIWNLDTRNVEKTLTSPHKATYPLAFSVNGKYLVTAARDVTLVLWDLENGTPIDIDNKITNGITSLAFNPDNKTLITGDFEGKVVKWDLSGNQITGEKLYEHSRAVNAISFSSDGQLMASGSDDRRVFLSDAKSNSRRRTFGAGGEVDGPQADTANKSISSVAFNEEGTQLAAGTLDEVFVWEIETGAQIQKFSPGPDPRGILVAFSDDNEFLTAFSFDGTLVVWDLDVGVIGTQFYNPVATHSATLSGNARMLALPSDNGVVVWDVNKRTLQPGGSVRSGPVQRVAFSPSLETPVLAAIGGDGFHTTKWKISATNQQEDPGSEVTETVPVYSIAFSGDGKWFATGSRSGTIVLRDINDNPIKALDAKTGTLLEAAPDPYQESQPAPEDSEAPSAVVWKIIFDPTPGSPWLAAWIYSEVDRQSKIILWNTNESHSRELQTGTVTSLAYGSDGQTLAWSIADDVSGATKIVIKRRDENNTATLPCGKSEWCEEGVSSLAFSRKIDDGEMLIAAGFDDGKILIWEVAEREKVGAKPLEDSVGRVTDLAFGLDNRILAAVTNKDLLHPSPGVITLWDVETREAVGNPLRGHRGSISAIAFSADGKTLASGSDSTGEQSIILWDLDVKNAAENRFCAIAGCELKRPEIEEQRRNTSGLWWLPHKIFRMASEVFSKLKAM